MSERRSNTAQTAPRLDRRRVSMTPAFARVTALVIGGGIFVADTLTELEIAVAVLYVIVVLMSVSIFQRRGVLATSAACGVLTVLSYVLTRGGDHQIGLINSAISLTAIAATTYLALRIDAAQIAIADARTQLLHMSRVSSLGELAASIAHEVNQPLAGIAAHGAASTRWLDTNPPNLDEARRSAARIVDDAKRASAIIARVRSLARKGPAARARADINEAVRDVLGLVAGELRRSRINVRSNLAVDLPPVQGDQVQLEQVVLNLILNAVDAMAESPEPRELIVTSLFEETDGVVRISFSDTGAGLEVSAQEKIFDAFYSTKSTGVGMGLTISRSIVEAHGGKIWSSGNSGRGATLQFTLPAAYLESTP